MPIKPKLFAYICPSCSWKKVISPKSDCLTPWEYYACCPDCGNKNLKTEEVGTFYGYLFKNLNS